MIGQSLNKISTSAVTTSSIKAPMQTKAAVAGDWNQETFIKKIIYIYFDLTIFNTSYSILVPSEKQVWYILLEISAL